MEIYSDIRKCIKCGFDVALDEFHEPHPASQRTRLRPYCLAAEGEEHIKRKCARCDYEWAETCLDSASKAEG